MVLCWEVDDPTWEVFVVVFRNKHVTDPDVLLSAGLLVFAEVVWEGFFEKESNPFPHHADRIHRVDERFGPGFEKIAFDKSDH